MGCYNLSPDELQTYLDQGYTLQGGPFTTEDECLASCSSSSSSSGIYVSCCEIELPAQLIATVNTSSCIIGNTPIIVPLFWNGSSWTGNGSLPNCGLDISLGCSDNQWTMIISPIINCDGQMEAQSQSCDPFILEFNFPTQECNFSAGCCETGFSGTFSVEVTF